MGRKAFEIKVPLKAKKLKIIDHLGTLYATFDGSSVWKIDKVAFGILKMCDGKKTVEKIVEDVAKMATVRPKELKPVMKEIFGNLEKMNFIEWV